MELPRVAAKIKVVNGALGQGLAVQWEQVVWKGLWEEGLERGGLQRLRRCVGAVCCGLAGTFFVMTT